MQAYFDTELTAGIVTDALSEQCDNIKAATGNKAGTFAQALAMFAAAVALSLWKSWQLTLVMLAITPLLGFAGTALARVVRSGAARSETAYALAHNAAREALANMRTVASFQAEDSFEQRYAALLEAPRRAQVTMSTVAAAVDGFVKVLFSVSQGVAFLYGSALTHGADPEYTAGDIMTVIFGVTVAGFALGQAAPLLPVLLAGVASKRRLDKIVEHAPSVDVQAEGLQPGVPLKVRSLGCAFALSVLPDSSTLHHLQVHWRRLATVHLRG